MPDADGWERASAEPNRDQWGRPLVVPPEGGKPTAYTRCTTFVGCLEDTYNLGQWQRRMVAAGLARRPDLLLRASSLGLQPGDDTEAKRWKQAMNTLCDSAQEAAEASASATIGTALHAITEQIDRGLDPGPVPAGYGGHLEAYIRATAGFEALGIEQFTVLDSLKIGGTPDRVLRIPGRDKLVIGDVKTGSVEYGIGKMCMQLSVYARSRPYDARTGNRSDYPGEVDLDRGLIIALDAKTGLCRLIWVDLAAGWEAVQLAAHVRAWRQRRGLSEVWSGPDLGTAVPSQASSADWGAEALPAESRAALGAAIRDAGSEGDLVELWRAAGVHWTAEHTALAAERKAELLAAAS